jgi:putative membrane protein
MMFGGNMFGMAWMWFFGILLVLGTILLVVVLVKAFVGPGDAPHGPNPNRARAILEERFARGEINADEFRERLRILEEG